MLLAKDTREGIGCDNMTAILIALKPYPWLKKIIKIDIIIKNFLIVKKLYGR